MNINVSLFLIHLLLISSLTFVQSGKPGFVNSPKNIVEHRLHHSSSAPKFPNLKGKNKISSNLDPNLPTTATSLLGKSLSGLRPVVNELKSRLSSKLIRNTKHEPSSSNVNQIKFPFSEPKVLKFNRPFERFKTNLLANHSKNRLRHHDIRPLSAPSYKSKPTVLSLYAKSASEQHQLDDRIRGPKHRPYREAKHSSYREAKQRPYRGPKHTPYRGPTKYSAPSEENEDYQDDVKYSQRDTRYDDEPEQNDQSPDYEESPYENMQARKRQPPNRNSFFKDFEESEEDNFGPSHEPKKIRELEQGVEYGVEALAEKQVERQIEQALPGGVPYESYEQGSDGYNENDNDPYNQPYSTDYDNDQNYAARQKTSFNNFFASEPRPRSKQYWNSPKFEMRDSEIEYPPNGKW